MKQRGKIESSPKSLSQTKRGLWYSAAEKLNEAHAAVREMDLADDRVKYEAGWIRFVDSLEESWNCFYDEGRQSFSKFQPWAGKFISERKSDSLLQYLIQARHQSQHGRIVLEWGADNVQIAPDYFGCIKDLKIFPDNSFEVDANPSSKTSNEVRLVHHSGEPLLPNIQNKKHNQIFMPPVTHKGQPISKNLPIDIAQLGLLYYENVFDQAMKMFSAT